jgi:hypothetical protein
MALPASKSYLLIYGRFPEAEALTGEGKVSQA